ncbi:MAG: STAS/SEC14 domain-containing protein [Mycobacterium sp.]
MIEGMPRSHDNVLGFRVSGDVTRADYDILEPAVQTVVESSGSVRLLLDMSALHGEKAEAWGADLRFDKKYHRSIERMALVGLEGWKKWLTRLTEPFYARQVQYFTDVDQAWAWLDS